MYRVRDEYENLVKQYHVPLYRFLYGYCGNKYDAEDGVQTAYLRLWQSRKMFLSEKHAKNWLYLVAINYIKDLKRNKWSGVQELDENVPFTKDEDIDLYDAIFELPEDYRVVILLYYYEDYSTKEISKLLGVNESTIRTKLQRARERLRTKLEDAYGK